MRRKSIAGTVVSCIRKRVFFVSLLALFGNALATAQSYRWEVIAHKRSDYPLTAVTFVDSLHGWASGDSMYFTTDGGFTWPSGGATYGYVYSYRMLDTLEGWATGTQSNYFGLIAHTSDGGRSWQQQYSGIWQQLWDSWAFSPMHLLAVGDTHKDYPDTAMLLETMDGGKSWTRTTGTVATGYNHVYFSDSRHGWTTTRGFLNADTSVMLRTSDGGKNWEQISLAQQFSRFSGLFFLDSLRGWTGDHFGGLFRTSDGGSHWIRGILTTDSYDDFAIAAISFTDSLKGWAFGYCVYQGIITEAVYHTTDGGFTWARESVGLTGDLGTLDDGLMLDSRHGWAVSGDGAILAYRAVPTGVKETERSSQPEGTLLKQNYPNPFNGQTRITYTLGQAGVVRLTLTDLLGRTVRTILPPQWQGPGLHIAQVETSGLASGLYFYHLTTTGGSLTRSMLILK